MESGPLSYPRPILMKTLRRSLPFLLLGLVAARGLAASAEPPMLPLWPGEPPGMVAGATPGTDDGTGRYWRVGVPGLLLYLPEGPAPEGGRMALIACCGGGYTHLTRLVGADGAVAAFLPRNVAIISLKYRTSPPSADLASDALADGERAVRFVREHAREWGIAPDKIGMVGWSAGANLALNVASHFDAGVPDAADPVQRRSSRPDFVVLLSPWPAGRTIADYPIRREAPAAFIGSAEDDKTAPADFARAIGKAYQDAGAASHLWIVPTGGHGAFTIDAPGEGGKWIARLMPWLESQGLAPTFFQW
jgi:endo-1,4-beta-xylanase